MKSQNAKVKKEGLPSGGEVSYVMLDLADLDTIKGGVDSLLQKTTIVDYVILNAGIMACPYKKTKNNLEMQIGEQWGTRFVFLGFFFRLQLMLHCFVRLLDKECCCKAQNY